MHISKNCFINFGVTFVMPKKSIYTEPINKIIIRARQSGLTQKIIKDIEWDIQRTAEGRRLPVGFLFFFILEIIIVNEFRIVLFIFYL